jgi:hypothetical protein
MRPPSKILVLSAAVLGLVTACGDDPAQPASALSGPIDFNYACEGDGVTVAPENDESTASFNETRMCPDFVNTFGNTVQGDLFGVVLNRQPPGLSVMQLNPATGTRQFLDANAFVPGTTAIPVGRNPTQIIRAQDFGAFYVLSAGDQNVTRVQLTGFEKVLSYETVTFALPGTPASGVALTGTLFVAAADTNALWRFDLSGDPAAPALTTIAVADRIRTLATFGDELLVTWQNRPVVSRLTADGTVLSEAGLAAACRDSLDNDGDGLVDRDDPDCADADDDDESDVTGSLRVTAIPAAAGSATGAAPCNDGVDNDGDGHTDFPNDAVCDSATDTGESLPGCSDGVDNDFDGLIDFPADPSCYSAHQLREVRLSNAGPYEPVVIDAEGAGQFAYVLDVGKGEIAVFGLEADGGLTRVDVNAADQAIPALTSVSINDLNGEPRIDEAVQAVRFPAYRQQGRKNIEVGTTNVTALSASRLRGELWSRLIDGGSVTVNVGWQPARCTAGTTSTCDQPALDDETWYAFGPRLDGRLQLIEAARRGVPTHRLVPQETDLDQRGTNITGPRLTLRGELIGSRGVPQIGFPFIGAAVEELLTDSVTDVSPARLRRFGLWPAEDFEQVPTETWNVTFEGTIPGTAGRLGQLNDATTFFDANAQFCEQGVAVGDWLALDVPTATVAASLLAQVAVVTDVGDTCPAKTPEIAKIEVRVTTVGQSTLTIDPTTARLRPQVPELDEDAITAAGLSRRACEQALDLLTETVWLPENLIANPDAVTPASLPSHVGYRLRVGEQFAVVGTVSGFLHRQRWDRATSSCVIDDTLDPRLTARHTPANVDVTTYATCPPSQDQLGFDVIEQLVDPATRFENVSFAFDVLPGCRLADDGITIEAVASQQDTVWSFTISGPHSAQTLAVPNSLLGVRVPIIEFRRHLVQLDAAANRASVLQVRPKDPDIITILE